VIFSSISVDQYSCLGLEEALTLAGDSNSIISKRKINLFSVLLSKLLLFPEIKGKVGTSTEQKRNTQIPCATVAVPVLKGGFYFIMAITVEKGS
jgi:hypothetical protein